MKKIFLIVASVILISTGGYIAWKMGAKADSPPADNSSNNSLVTVEGRIVCLPHKNSEGPHTMECALGLRDDQKRYYGLKDMPEQDIPVETRVRVEGNLQNPPADEKYGVEGNIAVKTFTRL